MVNCRIFRFYRENIKSKVIRKLKKCYKNINLILTKKYNYVNISVQDKVRKNRTICMRLKGRYLTMCKWMKNVMVGSLVGILAFGAVPVTYVGAEESSDDTTIEIPDDVVAEASVASSITLYANGTKNKTYTMYETVNENVPYSQKYNSSDVSVAKVSNEGVITAVTPGKAVITTKVSILGQELTLKTNVTVKSPYLNITNLKKTLAIGNKYNLAAKAYGLSGKITWRSSNKKVASINKNTGLVVAKKSGKSTIKALCSGFKKAYNVTVK